jgi:poly(3-hydroxybutyrate) depolymerase
MQLAIVPTNRTGVLAPTGSRLLRGTVLERTLGGTERLPYFLYAPRSAGPRPPLFVTVHGISRNARQHATLFAPLAERYGVVVVAPLFPADEYGDYQRLGRGARARRADRALETLVEEVGRLTGAQTDRFYLFGYSGGGQFAHRFTMAHPHRVEAYAVGAAGWYTFPDPSLRYPWGVQTGPSLPDVEMLPPRFLGVPATVFVGDRDTRPGSALRKTRRVNEHQGESRLERAQRWVQAMRQAAREAGVPPPIELVPLPGCGHSFKRCMKRGGMGAQLFSRLFAQTGPATGPGGSG